MISTILKLNIWKGREENKTWKDLETYLVDDIIRNRDIFVIVTFKNRPRRS